VVGERKRAAIGERVASEESRAGAVSLCKWRPAANVGTSRTLLSLFLGSRVRVDLVARRGPLVRGERTRERTLEFRTPSCARCNVCRTTHNRECVHHLRSVSRPCHRNLPFLFLVSPFLPSLPVSPLHFPSLIGPTSSLPTTPAALLSPPPAPPITHTHTLSFSRARARSSVTCPARSLVYHLRNGAIVAFFLVCARQCSVAPFDEFACRQHGGRCGGATIVVSKRGECYATTAAPSRCP
jgi:hypothetical protein